MSRLIKHAKEEFKIAGYTPLDQEQEEGPNKWIQENILELLEVFSKQSHSRFSASYCIKCFEKLASFGILTPLKCDNKGWVDVGGDSFQNNRLSDVFKKGKEGEPYYLNAIVWEDEKGGRFTGSVLDKNSSKVSSWQYINFPFIPKTFYIDVIEKEISKDNFETFIKDHEQLKEVFEYYKRGIEKEV